MPRSGPGQADRGYRKAGARYAGGRRKGPGCSGPGLLLAIIQKFDGGPVGVDSLSAALGEERGTIEDVIEPYLIQQGLLMRTSRGRVATRSAWRHFGLQAAGVHCPASAVR